MVDVHGDVAPGFERVADEFARNFTRRGERGAAVAVHRHGELVVDLWAGRRDTREDKPWERDTVVPVFSTTKGIAALVVALVRSRGLLDYDERVTRYWPEFGTHGKGEMTVRQLLEHRAGVAVLDPVLRPADLLDLDALAATLAAQSPCWRPGSRQGYHAITLGLYQNELVRRVDPAGRTIGTILAEEIAGPLYARFLLGLPPDFDLDDIAVLGRLERTAALRQLGGVPWALAVRMADKRSLTARSLSNPRLGAPERFTRRTVLEPEVPSSNGVANARGIATIYGSAATASDRLPIDADTLELLALPVLGPPQLDVLLRARRGYSLGFSKPVRDLPFGSPGGRSYGTAGLGGSFGFADPDAGLGYGYVTNRLGIRLSDDPREVSLRTAVYACV